MTTTNDPASAMIIARMSTCTNDFCQVAARIPQMLSIGLNPGTPVSFGNVMPPKDIKRAYHIHVAHPMPSISGRIDNGVLRTNSQCFIIFRPKVKLTNMHQILWPSRELYPEMYIPPVNSCVPIVTGDIILLLKNTTTGGIPSTDALVAAIDWCCYCIPKTSGNASFSIIRMINHSMWLWLHYFKCFTFPLPAHAGVHTMSRLDNYAKLVTMMPIRTPAELESMSLDTITQDAAASMTPTIATPPPSHLVMVEATPSRNISEAADALLSMVSAALVEEEQQQQPNNKRPRA